MKLPHSIWYTSPLASDYKLCRKAYSRLKAIAVKGGVRVEAPQDYSGLFNSFVKLQRLGDSKGRRLFMKEKRYFTSEEMYDISHGYIKGYALRKILALQLVSHKERRLGCLKSVVSILSRGMTRRIMKESGKKRVKAEATSDLMYRSMSSLNS